MIINKNSGKFKRRREMMEMVLSMSNRKSTTAMGVKDMYCPLCGRESRVISVEHSLAGKVYMISCQQHGVYEVEIWRDA